MYFTLHLYNLTDRVKNNANNINWYNFKFFDELACRPELRSMRVCSAQTKIKIWLLAFFQKYWRSKSVQTLGMEEHLDSVERVLQVHLETSIRLQPSKKTFFLSKIDFLGLQVSGDGIKPVGHALNTIWMSISLEGSDQSHHHCQSK